LLVLARNREKDKERSVAVTPVAPRPSPDEPPPSSELSALRARPDATPPEPAAVEPERSETGVEQLAASEAAASGKARATGKLAWLLAAALGLIAGYCAVELLHLY
ncbi:MAG TPA: hypothetical protein VG963_25110, partial [Polyangiaceae bacterium]|nr:hypothetical protein [Polyangiaceae bacterium]